MYIVLHLKCFLVHGYTEPTSYLLECLRFQPASPIRSEIDVKLGGTQCNLMMGRLKPLMKLSSSKKKKMVQG